MAGVSGRLVCLPGKRSVALLVIALLSVLLATTSTSALPSSQALGAEAAGKNSSSVARPQSCMVAWLQLTPGIREAAARRHEQVFKYIVPRIDESSSAAYNMLPLSAVLGSHVISQNFLSCLTRKIVRCAQQAPCRNGGQCVFDSAATRDYQCKCKEGFTGHSCEQEIPSCVPNPCLNGGACVEVGGYESVYRCKCPPLHTGKHCESTWLSAERIEGLTQTLLKLEQQFRSVSTLVHASQANSTEELAAFLSHLERSVSSSLSRSLAEVKPVLALQERTVEAHGITLSKTAAALKNLTQSLKGQSARTSYAISQLIRLLQDSASQGRTLTFTQSRLNILEGASSEQSQQISTAVREMVTLRSDARNQGRRVSALEGRLNVLERSNTQSTLVDRFIYVYQGVRLRAFNVQSSTDLRTIAVGCQQYVPSRTWTQVDFQAICERFRTGTSTGCTSVDTDHNGGSCTNHNAVLSFESNSNPDVWVNSRVFSWDPSVGVDDCNLVSAGSNHIVVYACR